MSFPPPRVGCDALTLVVVWLEPENELIWCVADSRLVGGGGGSLTDSAPKILPIDVACSRVDGPPSPPFLKIQVGFAFAGSALSALATHGFVSACLLNLMCSGPPVAPPDLQSVHDWIGKIAETYIRDIRGAFEFLLFGYCPLTERLRAFHFCASVVEGVLAITSCERRLSDRWEIVAIGSGAREFQDRFADVSTKGAPFQKTSRVPRAVVEDMIGDQSRADVGGDVQIAYANQAGLHRLQSVVPICPGSPFPRMTFLGQDTNDFGQVGAFFVGMPGVS